MNDVHSSLKKVLENKTTRCLGIITRFYNKYLNIIEEAKDLVIDLLKLKNVNVQNEVARSLNEEFKPNDDLGYFQECLNLLSFTDAKYDGVYGIIQFRLKDAIDLPSKVIIDFINNWILNNKGSLKKISVLKEIVYDLYSKDPIAIQNLFLQWLNSENSLFKHALQFMIGNLSSRVDTLGLSKKNLKSLSETDTLYVVYMIGGYILDRKYATEMLFNILEVNFNNKRIKIHIASIFVHYLIKNYYSITNILKEKRKKSNKVIMAVIDQIIDNSERYYNQISELNSINEFEPSEKRMNYFLKQQNIQMQELMDASENKKSSIMNLFTNISLRAGKSSFTKYDGVYSQESEMQKISSSVEVARVQYIDEIGQMKLRLMWQNMKRDELPN